MYELVNRIAAAAQTGVKAVRTELFTKPDLSPLHTLLRDQAKLNGLWKYCPEHMRPEFMALQADMTKDLNLLTDRGNATEWEMPTQADMGRLFRPGSNTWSGASATGSSSRSKLTWAEAKRVKAARKNLKSPLKVLAGHKARLSKLLGQAPTSMFGEIHFVQEGLDNEIAQVKAHGVSPEIWAQVEAEMGYPHYANQLADLEVRISDPEVVELVAAEKAAAGEVSKKAGGKHRKVSA